MNTFHDLFRQPTRKVGDSFPIDRRRELFPGFVERSPRLHLWSPGDPIADVGPRLLIGIATWSGYDLNLLDLIEEQPTGLVHVDVFDIDAVRQEADWNRSFPGLPRSASTPFVGHWRNGHLGEVASGQAGRELAARILSLPSENVASRMGTILTRL